MLQHLWAHSINMWKLFNPPVQCYSMKSQNVYRASLTIYAGLHCCSPTLWHQYQPSFGHMGHFIYALFFNLEVDRTIYNIEQITVDLCISLKLNGFVGTQNKPSVLINCLILSKLLEYFLKISFLWHLQHSWRLTILFIWTWNLLVIKDWSINSFEN